MPGITVLFKLYIWLLCFLNLKKMVNMWTSLFTLIDDLNGSSKISWNTQTEKWHLKCENLSRCFFHIKIKQASACFFKFYIYCPIFVWWRLNKTKTFEIFQRCSLIFLIHMKFYWIIHLLFSSFNDKMPVRRWPWYHGDVAVM